MPEPITDERRKQLLVSEPSVMQALIAAPDPQTDMGASARATVVAIEDVPAQPDFAFRIVPISEDVYKQAETANTPPKRNPLTNGTYRDPADLNESEYRADLIVRATHPEDAKLLWHNKELLASKGCTRSVDLVNKLLPTGWKLSVVNAIDRVSGTGKTVTLPTPVTGEHDCPLCGLTHESAKRDTLENTLAE